MWLVLEIRIPFKVLLVRGPYYIGDLKRDTSLENCPCMYVQRFFALLALLFVCASRVLQGV